MYFYYLRLKFYRGKIQTVFNLFIILEWGFNKMKKLFSALLAGVMLTASSIGVYAADDTTIEIKTAKYDKTTEKVSVTGVIGNAASSQSLTVMSTGIKNEGFDMDTIVYIDQKDNFTVGADGSFSLDFYLSDSAVKGNNYFVRVGGTGIASPEHMAFLFSDSGDPEPDILYGDVNNDGVRDVNDAVMMLNYVLNPASANITDDGFKNAQINEEAKKPNEFTAADASMILKKVLDSNYNFPVERK